MPLIMIRNDITNVPADAIVNPANEQLLEGSGTSRAIYLAAGEDALTSACRQIGFCEIGQTVATPAFHLPSRYIFHSVGPVWYGGQHQEESLLSDTYRSALMMAVEYQLESIAFPLLSSGNYAFPKDIALRTAIRSISDFLMQYDLTVYLVLYDQNAVAIGKKLFSSLESYIDDHYVDAKNEFFPETQDRFRRQIPHSPETETAPSAPTLSNTHQDTVPSTTGLTQRLRRLFGHMDQTFSQTLLHMIDERNLKDSYVYKKANVDRRHFSKIRNNIDYTPNKKTVLAFAIALELSMDETELLLKRAGYAFSNTSKFDVIVCYFIENHRYDIFEINETLFAYDQPTLGE